MPVISSCWNIKSKQDRSEYRALLRTTIREIAAKDGEELKERLRNYISKTIEGINESPLNDVALSLKYFAAPDFSWEKLYLGSARMIEDGRIALLKRQGARLESDYQELHIILLSQGWSLPDGFKISKQSDYGKLTITCNSEEYKFQYKSGKIYLVYIGQEGQEEQEEFVCDYKLADLDSVREKIIEKIQEKQRSLD